MTQYTFGTGQLYSVPTGGGNPLRIGALQDVSIEFSGDEAVVWPVPVPAGRGSR